MIRHQLFGIGIQHANIRLGVPGVLELQRQIAGSLADADSASLLSRYLDHLLGGLPDGKRPSSWITPSQPMNGISSSGSQTQAQWMSSGCCEMCPKIWPVIARPTF